MGFDVTCPRGHVFDLDDAAANDEVRCPKCDLVVSVPASSQSTAGDDDAADRESAGAEKSKSLWQVMQRTDADQPSQDDEANPAQTDETGPDQSAEVSAAPKGLWNLMSDRWAKPSDDNVSDDSAAVAEDDSATTSESEGQSRTADRKSTTDATMSESPKGLWKLMDTQTSKSGAPATASTGPGTQVDDSPSDSSANLTPSDTAHSATDESAEATTDDGKESPKGLWNLMGASRSGAAPLADAKSDSTASSSDSVQVEFYTVDETDSQDQADDVAATTAESHDDDDDAQTPDFESAAKEHWDDIESSGEREPATESLEPEVGWAAPPTAARPRVVVKTGLTANSWISLLLGVLAVPLSGMAMLQTFWAKLPATIAGLAALVLGLQAVGEIRRSRGKRTGMPSALFGMLLGVAGMFLGPMVVEEYGQQLQQSMQREQTTANLAAIGKALQSYHGQHNQFPAGGIFAKDPNGGEVPMHGWMTSLLPYLGHEQLHRSIDFKLPYDADVNVPAMEFVVPQFLAAGIEKRTNARGFAVTHFAGVGGEFIDDQSGLVPVGIFGHNSKVTQADVSDGLSQTIAVGEIPNDFPPWGSPENWRAIGDGLNKDISGFGNSDNSGALFLKADGSVRFYSNKTQRRILQELSTRNAGDFVPEELR